MEYKDFIGYLYTKDSGSVSEQLQGMYDYCNKNNIKLSKVRIDIGKRRDFKHSFKELIRKHKDCCIMISKSEQISRDIKELTKCLEICSKNNIRIYSFFNEQFLDSEYDLVEEALNDLEKDGLICKEI